MSTVPNSPSQLPQVDSCGPADLIAVDQPAGGGNYNSVGVPLTAVAAVLAQQLAANLLTGSNTVTALSVAGGMLTVPDIWRGTVSVAVSATVTTIQSVQQSQGNAPINGALITILLPAGGTVLNQTYPDTAAVDVVCVGGTWVVKL